MPSEQPVSLPSITIIMDDLIQRRPKVVAMVMSALFGRLAVTLGVDITTFAWSFGMNDDVSFTFKNSPSSAATNHALETWKAMREKYPAVLIGEEYRKLRNSMPTYAKLGPIAFADAFATKVATKAKAPRD